MQGQSFENIGGDVDIQSQERGEVDRSLPLPELMSLDVSSAAEVRPYWAHRKIAYVDAYLATHPEFFENRTFIALQVQYNPRMTANDRYIRGFASVSGFWWIHDRDLPGWRRPDSSQHSAIVRLPTGGNANDLYYGMYFCPDVPLESSPSFVLWVQNYHKEGGNFVWEGGTPPNYGNSLGIDRGVGYPFPNGGRQYRFPG